MVLVKSINVKKYNFYFFQNFFNSALPCLILSIILVVKTENFIINRVSIIIKKINRKNIYHIISIRNTFHNTISHITLRKILYRYISFSLSLSLSSINLK